MNTTLTRQKESFDTWLLRLAMFGILIFAIMLNLDLWFSSSQYDGSESFLGSIVKARRDVRKKVRDGYAWLPLNESEVVNSGDSIFTGSDSTAIIKFETGVVLHVDPDSLIVLEKQKSSVKLDLKFGQLKGSTTSEKNSNLQLSINNQEMDLKGELVEFAMQKTKPSETKLRVLKGSAQLINIKNNKAIEVSQTKPLKIGRAIASNADEVLFTVEPEFVEQEKWGHDRNFWMSKKQELPLSWKADGPIDSFELLISEDASFKKNVEKKTLMATEYKWPPLSSEGSIFWKVKAFYDGGSKAIETDVIQWRYGVLSAPEWLESSNSSVITKSELFSGNDQKSPPFALHWSSGIRASLYHLQWSENALFTNPKSVDLKINEWRVPKLDVGKYFVRLRSEALGRPASDWSKTLDLEIVERDPDGLVNIRAEPAELETLENLGAPTLVWQEQQNTSGYQVEISSKQDFSQIDQAFKVNQGRWTGAPRARGDYYVRLLPLALSGRRGPISAIIPWHSRASGPRWFRKENKIEIVIPRDGSNKLMSFPETNLEWQDTAQGKVNEYIVEQADSPEFKEIKLFKVTEPRLLLKEYGVGTYYMRVRSVFSDGSLSVNSQPLLVKVIEQTSDEIGSPILLSKSLSSEIGFDGVAASVLEWKKIGDASGYKVQIAESGEFSRVLTEISSNSPSAKLSMDKAGTFYLRVAGLTKRSFPGPWSEVIKWKVGVSAPVLISMAPVRVTVAAADSRIPPAPVVLRWRSVKILSWFNLQVAEDKEFKKILVNEKVQKNEFKYMLTKAGKYNVRVKGITETDLQQTDYSKPEELVFIVERPLVVPELLTPRDRVSYILAKMKNPEIWLEWKNKDSMSNLFLIQFSKDKDFGTILNTFKSREPKLLLDHKTIRGKLYWRVKALNDEQSLESPWSSSWSLSVVDIESED